MKAFVAVTDPEWYRFLLGQEDLDEVNFCRPLGATSFRALLTGQPFLFKLPYPDHAIVGGGFFAHFSAFPASLAWDAFGQKNGAPTFGIMRERIEKYRRRHGHSVDPHEDYEIGCIVLVEPFLLPRGNWVPAPADWKPNIVTGRTEDLTTAQGQRLWESVLGARGVARNLAADPGGPMYGEPAAVRPRLGQGAFRILVTDAYSRHCAVTGDDGGAAGLVAVGGARRVAATPPRLSPRSKSRAARGRW